MCAVTAVKVSGKISENETVRSGDDGDSFRAVRRQIYIVVLWVWRSVSAVA